QPERQVLATGVHPLDLVALPVGRGVPLVHRHVEAVVVALHVDVLDAGVGPGTVVLDALERAEAVAARLRVPHQRPAGRGGAVATRGRRRGRRGRVRGPGRRRRRRGGRRCRGTRYGRTGPGRAGG